MDSRAAAAKRAYMKKWRAKNKDKIRVSNERYWAKVAAQQEEILNGNSDNSADSTQG